MRLEEILSLLVPVLEHAQVPYMLTGSVASSAHGMPRSTRDIDIVVDPTREQLQLLMREFPSDRYYADEQQALQAFSKRSQFNVIDSDTGWKVDFIVAQDSAYGRAAFARRMQVEISGVTVYVASPEDVVISKLQWAKQGASDRQLQDAKGILDVQGDKFDFAYIKRWVRELRLEEQWQVIRRAGPTGSS